MIIWKISKFSYIDHNAISNTKCGGKVKEKQQLKTIDWRTRTANGKGRESMMKEESKIEKMLKNENRKKRISCSEKPRMITKKMAREKFEEEEKIPRIC